MKRTPGVGVGSGVDRFHNDNRAAIVCWNAAGGRLAAEIKEPFIKKKMILALAAVAAVSTSGAKPSQAAYQGPWCAYMSLGLEFYSERCDLPNYEACRNEIMGTPGTWCTQNPRYRGPVQPSRTKRKPRY